MVDSQPSPARQNEIADDITRRAQFAVEQACPLFLIVYYTHEHEKLALLEALRAALRAADLQSESFDPCHRPEHREGRLIGLLAQGAEHRAISLVIEFPREVEHGESSEALNHTFLNYLNLQRDQITYRSLRIVFFLRVGDAEQFIHQAGDLWDFRETTYWLEGRPEPVDPQFWREPSQWQRHLALNAQDQQAIQAQLEKVRPLIEETEDGDEKAALLLDLTGWLRRNSAYALATKAAMEGLNALAQRGTQLEADLEHALGDALNKNAHFSEALTHYQQSLAIRRKIGDKKGEGTTLNNISQIYHAWGRYQDALETLQQSLAIRRGIGDKGGEGVTLNNISRIYYDWGRYQDALEMLQQSLALRREIGDKKGEGVTLNNISQIYHDWGRYQDALEMLQQSLVIRREIGDKKGEGTTLNNISQIYRAWGRNQDALETLQQSLAIYREIGDKAGEGTALNNISQVYRAWGRNEGALETLQQSLAIYREIGDQNGEATVCWNLGLEWERRGEMPKAIEMLRQAVSLDKALDHPDYLKNKEYLERLQRPV